MVDEPAAPAPEAAPAPAEPAKSLGETLYPEGKPEGEAPAPEGEKPPEGEPAKPEGEKPAVEGEAPKPEGEPAKPAEGEAVVPAAAADYKIELPAEVKVDDALMSEFKELAFEAKLPNGVAQKLVATYVKGIEGQVQALVNAHQAEFNATQEKWQKDTLALPEFAGGKWDVASKSIAKVMDEFGSPELRQILDATGAGNNPSVVQFMHKVAEALGEGKPAPQGKPIGQSAGPKSLGQQLYGDKYDKAGG